MSLLHFNKKYLEHDNVSKNKETKTFYINLFEQLMITFTAFIFWYFEYNVMEIFVLQEIVVIYKGTYEAPIAYQGALEGLK